jgi:TolA-binding protein
MQHPRKKITRKELKQDKFILATLKAKDFLEKNSKIVFRSIILLVAIIVVVIFLVRSKRSANVNAASMLSRAQFMLGGPQQETVADSLKIIIDRYDGTVAAGKATFLLAKIYWEDNDFENAKVYFKKYIDDYTNETVVSQSALAGYADCLIKEENYEEGAEYYERAAEVDPKYPETPEFLFSAATAYKEAGKIDKAEKLVERLLADYNNPQIKNKAEVLLEDLKYAKS